MLEQKEIDSNHQICLELLDKFLEVCNKYKINYYLAFGSCLGSVRHQGFIPWDINIDVLLMADDYYKLNKAMKAENLGEYVWFKPQGNGRIRNLLMRKDSLEFKSKPNIDVAVYCNAPNNDFLRYIVQKVAYLNVKMFKLKNTRVDRVFPFNVLKRITMIIPDEVYYKVISFLENHWKSQKDTEYYMVSTPSIFEDRETIKYSWFGKNSNYGIFEGRKVKLLDDCHNYLVNRYGKNYMTPIIWEDKGEYSHAK